VTAHGPRRRRQGCGIRADRRRGPDRAASCGGRARAARLGGPEIAPDSTLIFEVELLSIQSKSDEKTPDKK
jgi:hypothetical protein